MQCPRTLFDMMACGGKRFEVPATRNEQVIVLPVEACNPLEMLAKQVHSLTASDRQENRFAIPVRDDRWCLAGQVDLVADDGDRLTGGHRRNLAQRACHIARGIDDEQHAIGARNFGSRPAHAFGLDNIGAFMQPRRIHDVQRQTVDLYPLAQDVARRAGNVRDDGSIGAGERVQQRGFPGVRRTGDHDRESVVQQSSLGCGCGERFELFAHGGETQAKRVVRQQVDFLVGKIDGRFDVHAQLDQRFDQRVYACGELSVQRTKRGARGLRGSCIDEIRNGFGLREVHAIVQERAFAEFAGTCDACTEGNQPLQEQIEHHGAAVSLELDHVLSGERVWRRKIKQQTFVDHFAVAVAEPAKTGTACARQLTGNMRCDIDGCRSGKPHHTDAAASRGCGDGGDGFNVCAGRWHTRCFPLYSMFRAVILAARLLITPEAGGMNQERVTFESREGHGLSGVLHRPDGEPAAWVLFAHCFTCTKNVKAAVHVSQALVDHGFGVLRFDFTGLGESEGEFADTTFSSNVQDLVSAADYLAREYRAPSVLIGHSLGGAAVLRAAHQLPGVDAIATIAAPADPAHVRRLFSDDAERTIKERGEAEVRLAGRPFIIGKAFVQDLERDDWRDVIRGLRRPLLIFHSPIDDVVSIENARLIYDNALHPKSFVSLQDADHLLTRAADSRYVAAVLAAWVSRYLDAPAVELAEDEAVEGVVATIGRKKFRTELRSGRHVLIADEPVAVGGDDLGLSPYDLLAASLASCTAMTLRLYADHKRIDLAQASVRVQHDRVHEKDCEDCEKEGHRVDRLRREISVSGNLDDAQRQRLLEIADRCPVHKTLTNMIRIETRAADK